MDGTRNSEHGWELSKENVAPLARGRDQASLDIALNATPAQIAEGRAHHEASVRNAAAGRGPHAGDPLAPACSYIKWASDAYPPRSPQLVSALEGVCFAFENEDRYRDDGRYVNLWIRYANARSDSLDILLYMRSKNIGSKTGLFYEAWATTLEYLHDFEGSDNVYTLGLNNDAQPRRRLEQRREEFLARMVQRRERDEEKRSKTAKGPVGFNSRTWREERSRKVNDENARPALAPISGPPSTDAVAGSQRPRLKSALSRTEFKMFSDPKPNELALRAEPSFQNIAKADDVAKENEGLPSKWAGATLPQSTRSKKPKDNRKWSFFRDENPKQEDTSVTKSYSDPVRAEQEVPREESRSGASPTINTRIAMREVEEMFNSPLPFEYPAAMDHADANPRNVQADSGSKVNRGNSRVTDNIPRENIALLSDSGRSEPPGLQTEAKCSTDGASCMTDWCLELIPELPGFDILEPEKSTSWVENLVEGSLIRLQSKCDSRQYLIESKLGEGHEGKSEVFSAVPVDDKDGFGDADDADPESVAIKVASTINLAWEFYIYHAVHARLSKEQACLVPFAQAFFNGAPVSCLIIDRVGVATLAQMMEIAERKVAVVGPTTLSALAHRKRDRPISERVAMFFVAELLKALEAIHGASIIHSDVTLENIIVRNDGKSWSGGYNMAGNNGWGQKGVALIDFNHAIDTRHSAVPDLTADAIAAHAAFLGNTHLAEEYVKGGDRKMPWGFNADCYAAGICARKLLCVEGDNEAASLSSLKYREVWEHVLEQLSGVGPKALSYDTIGVMRDCRYRLEDELAKEPVDDVPLRAQLHPLFIALSEARLAGDMTQG